MKWKEQIRKRQIHQELLLAKRGALLCHITVSSQALHRAGNRLIVLCLLQCMSVLLLLVQSQHPQLLFTSPQRQRKVQCFKGDTPAFIAGVAGVTGLCVKHYTPFKVVIWFHMRHSATSNSQRHLIPFWLQFPINMRYWRGRLLKQQC